MSGRRVHERFDYEMSVTLIYAGEEIPAVTRNVSLGGMYVITPMSVQYGEQLKVRFRLPALKEDTECNATVRWKKEDGLGIQFGSLRALEVWGLNQLFKSVGE